MPMGWPSGKASRDNGEGYLSALVYRLEYGRYAGTLRKGKIMKQTEERIHELFQKQGETMVPGTLENDVRLWRFLKNKEANKGRLK